MDPVLVWVGAAVVLAVLGWLALRVSSSKGAVAVAETPEAEKKTETRKKREAQKKAATDEAQKPKTSDEEAAVPSIADDDDVEITVVTASPSKDVDVPIDEEPPTSEPASEASKIEMIYEEEADLEEVTSPIARILMSSCGQSDGGKVRRRNEDSFLVMPERSVFAVADGMGGHVGGDIASKIAVETLRRSFESGVFDGKTESATSVPRRGREIACAVQMANQAILTRAKKDAELKDMGTTLVAARFSPNKQRVYIGHVGDSRCYRLRGNTLRQLTTDHTLLGLGLKGPGASALYQAVGVKSRITIDVIVDKPHADDVYLLCSDGLTKMAKDEDIRDVLINEPDVEAAVYGLIEMANDRGGRDNVTVILVKVLERAPKL